MLHYEGEFRDDVRDGRGVLVQDVEQGAAASTFRYEGEFRDDKRHGRVDEMTAVRETDNQRVTYRGSLDANQLMSGVGVLEAGNVRYNGDFHANQFGGQGTLEYQDTGSVFKG